MKKYRIRIVMSLVIMILLLVACQSVDTDQPSTTEIARTLQSTTELPPSTPIVETEISARFTISAELSLQSAITALYQAYFPGEAPVFVETNADLAVFTRDTNNGERPEIFPTFLENAIVINQTDSQNAAAFINFAISPEGQKVLIEAGELASTLTLRDQAGNQVQLNQPIERVISSYGPATAFIYSVNAEDRLVSASYLGARDPFGAEVMGKIDPRFPDIMGEEFFTQEDFNIEQAASLDPDLIITSARSTWLETASQLELSLFLFDAENPERLQEAVQLTGKIFGPNPSAYADAWVSYYNAVSSQIEEQTATLSEEQRPRVLFTGTEPLRVASGDMYQTDMINIAGGVSVSEALSGYWNDINLEQVVVWDPDVIIVPPYGGASVEAITESPEWQILDAVKERRVYQMPKLVAPWDTPAPDSVLGIVWLAERLHPDLVDLDCSEEADYFYNTFYQYAIPAVEIARICEFE